MHWRLGAGCCLAFTLACGPVAPGDGAGESSGSTSSSTGGSGIVSGPPTSGADDATSGPRRKFDLGPVLDLDTQPDSECMAHPDAEIDLVVETPNGTFSPTTGFFGIDYCCLREARLVLVEGDGPYVAVGIAYPEIVPSVTVMPLLTDWSASGDPLFGSYPAIEAHILEGEKLTAEQGTVDFLEPLDPNTIDPLDPPWLSEQIDVDAGGWTIQGTVRVPYCPELDSESCPCE